MATLRFNTQPVHVEYYRVNAFGMITSPGKFEGLPSFAPHYWELALAGFASDEDAYGNYVFHLDVQDWSKWEGLQGYRKLYMDEDEQGFVHYALER